MVDDTDKGPRIVEVTDKEPDADDLTGTDWIREAGLALVNAGEALLHGDSDQVDARVTSALVYVGSVQTLLAITHPVQYAAASRIVVELADEIGEILGGEHDAPDCLACSQYGSDCDGGDPDCEGPDYGEE